MPPPFTDAARPNASPCLPAGRDPLIEVALALEAAARSDEYFVKRKLYPNVDFFSGRYILVQPFSHPRHPLQPHHSPVGPSLLMFLLCAPRGALQRGHTCRQRRLLRQSATSIQKRGSAALASLPHSPPPPLASLPTPRHVCAGLVYRAMGFPPQFFTVLFAIPRIAGYLAHWRESLTDPDTKIIRPQQDYRVRRLPLAKGCRVQRQRWVTNR